jgi:hypothetical protein
VDESFISSQPIRAIMAPAKTRYSGHLFSHLMRLWPQWVQTDSVAYYMKDTHTQNGILGEVRCDSDACLSRVGSGPVHWHHRTDQVRTIS